MRSYLSAGLLCMAAIGAGIAQDSHPRKMGHVMVRPDMLKWGPGPASLPAGAQMAVLAGNPGQKGPFVIRAKLPDGYKISPHWHPTDENVTVLKGTFLMGTGEEFDAGKAEELPAGSFVRMPKEMRHFAMAKGDTIIQVHAMGPFEINYVNPADDPRSANK